MQSFHLPDFVDFEEPLKEGSSSFELAKANGKEDKAKEIYTDLEDCCKKEIENATSAFGLIRSLDKQLRSHMERGTSLFEGAYLSNLLSYVPYRPSASCTKIGENGKRNGGINIGTCTDVRIPLKFIEVNKDILPKCDVVSYSILETVKDERLTGKLSRYNGIIAKMNSYPGGNAYGDGIENLGVFWKAYESGYEIYVLENGRKSDLTEMALEKIGDIKGSKIRYETFS